MTLSPLFTWRSAVVNSGLPPKVKLTALCLSLHMNERGGSCFPSVKTLATESSLSERSVRYAVAELVNRGWLEKTQGGGNRSNTYRALTPAEAAALQPVQGSGNDAPLQVVQVTPADSAPTPAPAAAEGVIEVVNESVNGQAVEELSEELEQDDALGHPKADATRRLLAVLTDKTPRTTAIVWSLAARLSPAAIHKVRESTLSAVEQNRIASSVSGFAVNALKDELRGTEAA